MKLLNSFLFPLTVGFVSISLIGCAAFGSDVDDASKMTFTTHFTTLKWFDCIGPRTSASYSYLFEKSEEEVLRTCLASAAHYPVSDDPFVIRDPFCFSAKDAAFQWSFTVEIDGESWNFCKVHNEWHTHFVLTDRTAEMKLYALLENVLQKQPKTINFRQRGWLVDGQHPVEE